MDSFADLVGRDRRGEAIACRVGADSHVYTYDRFCTTAWKTAHVLRRLGVHEESVVGVVPAQDPKALLAVLGTGLLGATARLDPPREFDGRALVAPVPDVGDYALPPGGQRVGYGGDPEDPTVAHYEEQVWGENPVLPPEAPGGDARAVIDADGAVTQGDLLAATQAVADREGIDAGTTVALRTSLSNVRALSGALVPLVVGGSLVFEGDDGPVETDLAIGDGPEERTVSIESITV
ncbi:MAG TPA: hypothetical protein VJ898_05550 [Natrialbaceae archaeon]|nr:hypothetical protein [Natrialbaceae archaeon]